MQRNSTAALQDDLANYPAGAFLGPRQSRKTTLAREISNRFRGGITLFAGRVGPQALYRLWGMLAHQQVALVNASVLSRNLGIDTRTVNRYLDPRWKCSSFAA